MKKQYYSQEHVNGAVLEIARQLIKDGFKPDYIVGLTRGGLIPATLLSHFTGAPLETLKVSLRDDSSAESNLWMAEDAFNGKSILIVDDINDSGATLNWIKQDWQSSNLPDSLKWNDVWHQNVRFAVITNNLASEAEVDYFVHEVNKAENDVWIVYPWENFWCNNAV